MRRAVRSTIERGVRAVEFHRSNAHTDPSAVELAARLDAVVTRGEALAVQQRNGRLSARAANERKRKLRLGPLGVALRHLVRVGALAGREKSDLAGSLKFPPENQTNQAFLVAARQMVEIAQANKELLARHGLTDPMLTDLVARLEAFEGAANAAQAAKQARAGARTELEMVSREINELIRVLTGINRHRFDGNSEKLTEWLTAISVTAPPRRTPAEGTEPPSEGGLPKAA